jgi:hypothetical protein
VKRWEVNRKAGVTIPSRLNFGHQRAYFRATAALSSVDVLFVDQTSSVSL